MTGASKRVATFAPVWNATEKKLDVLRIPFTRFVFPACKVCNERFSDLEGAAQQVLKRMLAHEAINHQDLQILLSWLDKVRTGLWLAFYYLQKNCMVIDPHMAIAERVDRADRLVFIYRSVEGTEGVHIVGANVPAFQYLPVCFGLVINNLGFLNASTDFLLARRLGLPHGTAERWGDWPLVSYRLEPPRERIMLPVLRGNWGGQCTRVYQPMAGREMTLRHLEEHATSPAVQAVFGNPPTRSGKVLIEREGRLWDCSADPTMDWLPPASLDKQQMANHIFRECAKLQLRISSQGPGTKGLDKGTKLIVKAQGRLAAAVTKDMLKRLDES